MSDQNMPTHEPDNRDWFTTFVILLVVTVLVAAALIYSSHNPSAGWISNNL
jgi:hypothetical protein